MAVGTASGLLDDPDEAPQSAFKHAIVENYIPPFIAMVGSRATTNRVVILDGYAGRGRYNDDTPASSEILLQSAERSTSVGVSVFLIEKKRSDFDRLKSVTSEYTARGVDGVALNGAVEEHLEAVLRSAQASPLFLFLDPCGAVLPFASLSEILSGPRSARRPQTEVLLNFSANFTRRATGALLKGQTDNDGVIKLDETCGGQWWRKVATDAHATSRRADFYDAAEAVAAEYGRRLAAKAGSGATAVAVPVRAREHLQPVYHLVFVTRSDYGYWVFADAIGKARKKWMRLLGPLQQDDSQGDGLFSVGDIVEETIESEEKRSTERVRQNLQEIVADTRVTPRLVDLAPRIFFECLGQAADTSVRKAVRQLEKEQVVQYEKGRSNHVRDWTLTRA